MSVCVCERERERKGYIWCECGTVGRSGVAASRRGSESDRWVQRPVALTEPATPPEWVYLRAGLSHFLPLLLPNRKPKHSSLGW